VLIIHILGNFVQTSFILPLVIVPLQLQIVAAKAESRLLVEDSSHFGHSGIGFGFEEWKRTRKWK